MAARVQFKQAKSDAGSAAPAASYTSNPTSGNLLVAIFSWSNHGADVTLTPPAGWTEHPDGEITLTNDVAQRYFYKESVGAADKDVAATLSGSSRWCVSLVEYSDPTGWSTNPIDQKSSASDAAPGAAPITISSGETPLTTEAVEVVVACLTNKNLEAQTAESCTSVAEQTTANATANLNLSQNLCERITTTEATQECTSQLSASREWVGHIATFAPIGSGGGGGGGGGGTQDCTPITTMPGGFYPGAGIPAGEILVADGDAPPSICCPVEPPRRGTLGAIVLLESVSGMGPLFLEAYQDCPGSGVPETPLLQMVLSSIPTGGSVLIDSARHEVEVTQPDPETGEPVTTDGKYLLQLPTGRGIEWLEVRDCDDIGCFCARPFDTCSGGLDTFVTISTQLREG